MKLTKSKINKLVYNKSSNKQQISWDDNLAGFGIRVYPSGKKAFVVRYRVDGRRFMITLGLFGPLTLEQARKNASIVLAKVYGGSNPAEDKKIANRQPTLSVFSEKFMKEYSMIHKKSWKADKARFKLHILPILGSRKLKTITSNDIQKLHNKITKSGKLYEANRVIKLLSVVFQKAKKWKMYNGENPAKGIQLNKEKKRDRYVTPTELPRFAKAIDEEPNIYARSALWLYLLTGLRKSEVLRAKWEDVDWDRREIKISDNKSNRPHYLPLSEAACKILRDIPRLNHNPYIFCGFKENSHIYDLKKPWDRVRNKAKAPDVRIHDLRRTVGSWMAQSGNTLHLIGRVLNHSSSATTAIYARFGQDSVREALESHGKQIMGLAGKSESADILAFKKIA